MSALPKTVKGWKQSVGVKIISSRMAYQSNK